MWQAHHTVAFFAVAGALLGATSSARAGERGGEDGTNYRLWVDPPVGGVIIGYGEPGTTTQVHLAGLSFAVELPNRLSLEAGGGGLVSSVGGEPGIKLGFDGWAKVGLAQLVRWRGPDSGWEFQLASAAGYRYMERGKITYEDYGVNVERIHALSIDAGPVLTHGSDGGLNLAFRLMTGVILPFARTYSRANLYNDYPRSRLHFAVPLQFDIGLAFDFG